MNKIVLSQSRVLEMLDKCYEWRGFLKEIGVTAESIISNDDGDIVIEFADAPAA